MKRFLFTLALLSVTLIIAGCIAPSEEEITTPVEEFTGANPIETGVFTQAESIIQALRPKLPREGISPFSSGFSHEVKNMESEVLTAEGLIQLGEISRQYDKNQERRVAKVKGFTHIYTFSGFGITLITNDPYEEDFYKKQPANMFLRYKTNDFDVISQKGNKFIAQRFRKDKNSSLSVEFLSKKHSFSGCKVSKYDHREGERDLMASLKNYEIYTLQGQHGESCDRFGNNTVYFISSPKNPENYYKISWQDGCAPTCEIPGVIKIN